MRRRVKGDRAFKRLIKRLPDAVSREMEQQLQATGERILAEQKAKAKKRTGKLANALAMKLLPKTLRLKVGLLTKAVNRRFFYGRIIEFGRKAQTVVATRAGTLARVRSMGGRAGNYKNLALRTGTKGAYMMKIRAMAPSPFIYPVNREAIYAPFKNIWERAIGRAAQGITDE